MAELCLSGRCARLRRHAARSRRERGTAGLWETEESVGVGRALLSEILVRRVGSHSLFLTLLLRHDLSTDSSMEQVLGVGA